MLFHETTIYVGHNEDMLITDNFEEIVHKYVNSSLFTEKHDIYLFS